MHSANATARYKAHFNALMNEAFGFSFSAWHKAEVWPRDYVCYSIRAADKLLSNVSVYKMNMLVHGRAVQMFH